MKSLYYLITSRLLWGCAGLGFICYLIWSYGDLLTYSGMKPFASEKNKIIFISSIIAVYLIIIGIKKTFIYLQYRRKVNKSAKEDKSLYRTEKAIDKENKEKVEKSFKEISAILKKYQDSNTEDIAWFKKIPYFSRIKHKHFYQLPWYLFIGNENVGKETTLLNSELEFPLSLSSENIYLEKINIKNCYSWNLTEQSIFLNISSRLIDISNRKIKSEWSAITKTIAKYRSRQPINGIILMVSAKELLESSEDKNYESALKIRDLLLEISKEIEVSFPVYLTISKLDMVYGFNEYFERLNEQERNQILGFSLAGRETDNNASDIIENEIIKIKKALQQELPEILIDSNEFEKSFKAFTFTKEFSNFSTRLMQYINTAFKSTAFDKLSFPHGVFFTSALQKRKSAKDSLYLMKRLADTSSDVLQLNEEKSNASKSFFLKELFNQFFVKENNIAGVKPWSKLVYLSVYLFMISIVTTFICLFHTSYNNNKNYLVEINNKLPSLEQKGSELPELKYGEFLPIIYYLSNFPTLPFSQNFSLENVPLLYRFGFYKGAKVSTASEYLYDKALMQLLLPQIVQYNIYKLRNDYNDDVNHIYNALKVYLMFNDEQHYDGQFIYEWVLDNLKIDFKEKNLTQNDWVYIKRNLQALLLREKISSPYPIDNDLINRSREWIDNINLSDRTYSLIKENYITKYNLKDLDVMDIIGPESSIVFMQNNSKKKIKISNFYTSLFFYNVYSKSSDDEIEKILNDTQWVMGQSFTTKSRSEIKDAALRMYAQEFTKSWYDFLDTLSLKEASNLDQEMYFMKILSDQNSPLKKLSLSIDNYIAPPKNNDNENSTIKNNLNPFKLWDEKKNKMDIFYKNEIFTNFKDLIDITKSDPTNTGLSRIDDTIKTLRELHDKLIYIKRSGGTQKEFEETTNMALANVTSNSEVLPLPFSKIITGLVNKVDSNLNVLKATNIEKKISAEVGNFCRKAIANRYPVMSSSQKDILWGDFIRFFSPQSGLMDKFLLTEISEKNDYQNVLYSSNNTTRQGRIKNILSSFKQAKEISNTFFNERGMPSFDIYIKPSGMSKNIVNMKLDIDGQKISYSHGSVEPTKISWPGRNGTNVVKMDVYMDTGKTLSLKTEGSWALNRFFDYAKKNTNLTTDQKEVIFNIENKEVKFVLYNTSIYDPLGKHLFSCP